MCTSLIWPMTRHVMQPWVTPKCNVHQLSPYFTTINACYKPVNTYWDLWIGFIFAITTKMKGLQKQRRYTYQNGLIWICILQSRLQTNFFIPTATACCLLCMQFNQPLSLLASKKETILNEVMANKHNVWVKNFTLNADNKNS